MNEAFTSTNGEIMRFIKVSATIALASLLFAQSAFAMRAARVPGITLYEANWIPNTPMMTNTLSAFTNHGAIANTNTTVTIKPPTELRSTTAAVNVHLVTSSGMASATITAFDWAGVYVSSVFYGPFGGGQKTVTHPAVPSGGYVAVTIGLTTGQNIINYAYEYDH